MRPLDYGNEASCAVAETIMVYVGREQVESAWTVGLMIVSESAMGILARSEIVVDDVKGIQARDIADPERVDHQWGNAA